MAFIYPVNAPISQKFGINPASYQPNGHYGIDFACATGTEIRAIGDGVVKWADWNQNLGANPWNIVPGATGSGIFVAIDHGNGYVSLYCHLSETLMNIGDRVTAGAIIGKSGTTGNSTGPHLHLETVLMQNVNGYNYGRVDPASLMSGFAPVGSTKVEANQRKVGPSNANQRSEANTAAPVVRVVPGNTIETFSGYVIGEMVDSGGVRSNIWYKDNEGYVWAGAFTEQVTAGLADHTPVPALAANQRTVGPANLNQRSAPNTSASVVRTIPANTVETFNGFAYGESVTMSGEAGVRQSITSDIWYKDDLGYVWSGGFTEQKTNGLADQTPAPPKPAPAAPKPAPAPAPKVEPAYGFTPDFDFVEYHPANTWNMQDGNFPEKPTHVVIHQFDSKAKKPSLDGVISWFAKDRRPESQSSAHFSVSGKRIVQHVSLKDRAFHAGAVGNDYVGIETDPMQDADTIASTKKLLKALKEKYGYELKRTLHKDVAGNATSCGAEIRLDDYTLPLDTVPVPIPEAPKPEPADAEKAVGDFLDWLKAEYFKQK